MIPPRGVADSAVRFTSSGLFGINPTPNGSLPNSPSPGKLKRFDDGGVGAICSLSTTGRYSLRWPTVRRVVRGTRAGLRGKESGSKRQGKWQWEEGLIARTNQLVLLYGLSEAGALVRPPFDHPGASTRLAG
jgi:hypothetical protein